MRITTSLLISIIVLSSCSNYNSIKYGSKNNQLITNNIASEDFDNDKSTLSPVYHISPPISKCDTIIFKDGTISLYKAGNKGSKYMDVLGCDYDKRNSIKLSDIESIKFSNGIIWPPVDRACDTLYLTDGEVKVLKTTYMSTSAILGIKCDSKKNRTIYTRLKDIHKIHFSDNRIWVNSIQNSIRNSSHCDTITFYGDSTRYYRVGNKGALVTDLFNCETNSKIRVKNDDIKEIKFANGEVWPLNIDCDTVYTSKGEKLILRGVKKDISFLTGEETENQHEIVSIRMVKIKSVDYADGTTWVNKDVNDKSKYSFYRVRRALIAVGAIIGGIFLFLFIALLEAF